MLNQRIFSLVAGSILFLFGVFGFAFKNSVDVAGVYLFFSIVLGFWGIVSGFSKSQKEKSSAASPAQKNTPV